MIGERAVIGSNVWLTRERAAGHDGGAGEAEAAPEGREAGRTIR